MTSMTKRDAINGAMSVADDVAQGRINPADLEHQAIAECRALFGTVVGEGDPAWPVQLDVARQVLALGGVPADELAEWLAVERHRAGEPVSTPEPDETTPEPETSLSVALRPDSDDADDAELADVEPEPVAEVEPPPVTPVPSARRGEYDPLRGWSPSGPRR